MKNCFLVLFLFFGKLYAQVPSEQISTFQIIDTFAWKINGTIKIPTTSDSAIVVISRSPLTSLSFTNKFYGVGAYLSTGVKVVQKFYKGTNVVSFSIKSLEANTTYYLAAMTFNNNSNGIFYNQTNPSKLTIKTKGKTIGNYYKNLDTNKAVFLSQLTTLLQNHDYNVNWYSDFKNVVTEVYERDTFEGNQEKKYVICDYSGIRSLYTGYFSFASTNFNREHTLPKNWMNFRGVSNPDLVDYKEGADWHNLTVTDGTVNQQRSDYVFKIPKTPSTMGNARYYENKSNYNDTNNCFEPQNSYKGNAARCIFYMQLCYNGTMSKTWGFKNGLLSFANIQNQELLKQWARTDTVDNFEIARHEYIASVQRSRNPLIDFPDWIDCIDFNDIHQLKTCAGLIVNNNTVHISTPIRQDWDVWYYSYNPDQFILKLYNDKIEQSEILIINLSGQSLYREKMMLNEGENSFWLPTHSLPRGVYYMMLKSETRHKTMKLLVE